VFVVPDFGKIFLAELTLNREDKNEPHSYAFHLTMIRTELGCIAHGTTRSVNLSANGVTKP
jgi:hypothetical protein